MKYGASGFLVVLAAFLAQSGWAYYGRHSTEAMLTFEAEADVALPGDPTAAELNAEGRKRDKALARIDAQVQHLMGTFQSASFVDDFRHPGVLGEHYEIRFKKVTEGSDRGRKRLTYRFKGKVVFEKDAFRRSSERQIPIKMPLAPDLIYDLGVKRGKNVCTDEHYNTPEDFWYFWDPDKDGCPLQGDSDNVVRTHGTLTEIANTSRTYPEYDKLYGDNGNGEALEIAIFLGFIDDVESLRMHNRRDNGVAAFRYIEKSLKEGGFEVTERKDDFREYDSGREGKGINRLRRFEKRITALGQETTVRVLVLLADTMISSKDDTFHRYLVPALREADVLVYDGHSGLGGNLDLGSLPTVRFDKRKYQVFYFNGCSSYPYFNGMFFEAKGGSRNLDLVTSGLPTITDTTGPNVMRLVEAFVDGDTRSWQTILGRIEASNGDNGTYLAGVNGDEDNRWGL